MFKFHKFLAKVVRNFFNEEGSIYSNHDGNTPLHIAAKLGDSKTVKSLLEQGAVPEARNYYNETPMDLIKQYEVLPGRIISWDHVVTADILSEYIVNNVNKKHVITDLPDYSHERMEHLFGTHLLGVTYYDNEGVLHTDF